MKVKGVMKFILFVFVFCSLFSLQCRKDYGASSCINKKITKIKSQAKWNPPAEVNEYIYQGKHVYLFSADCCDQYNELYDESCNYICSPFGGFSGAGDGKCTDFSSTAQFVRLVWKDLR